MSYQVLARKWRPHNFSQVVGQQHVLTALSNGLAQNRVHHAYLFSGTRGVGKTTIARILAKSLNCELGVTATPCGKCENCTAIDEGRFVDLLEIDAASRTKVDDTRELLDNVQYKPAVGRYKVYLIDEVHMLSKHSFNALLKTLEEPPEYVKFLLATTDPQKLPITVLSRCLQFHLKAILPEQIEAQLAFILQQEKATFEHSALSVISKAAYGSMRDALSLTDQALAFGAGNIEYQSVLKMLGTLDNSHLQYLMHFIASGNVTKVFQKIEEFVSLGADFAKVHQELAALCHEVSLQQFQPQQTNAQKSAVQLLSERLSPEEVQLYYQIALQGYKDYSYAPNGKIALEMTVMRLLAFKPANYIELDESALVNNSNKNDQQSQLVTEVTAATSVSAPAPAVVNEAVANKTPVVEEIPAIDERPIESTPEVSMPVGLSHQHSSENVLPETSKIQPPAVDKSADNVPVQEIAASKATAEKAEPLTQVTNSRNMLRSHRLKRNETKKSQATTDHSSNEPVVASLINVDRVVSNRPAVPKNVVTTPKPIKDSAAVVNDVLPPIDNYHENEYVDAQFDGNNYDPYAAPAEFQMPEEQVTHQTNETHVIDNQVTNQSVKNIPAQPSNSNVVLNGSKVSNHVFFSDQPFEAREIDTADYVSDKLTDTWSLAIQQMKLVGLVKLLAKNSVMKQVDEQIVLTLKSDQQHLLNNSGLCEELQLQLKRFYGEQCSMYIELGNVEGKLTAFESESALYEQYLNNAKNAIIEDENIKAFVANCGAKVYENSVIPL